MKAVVDIIGSACSTAPPLLDSPGATLRQPMRAAPPEARPTRPLLACTVTDGGEYGLGGFVLMSSEVRVHSGGLVRACCHVSLAGRNQAEVVFG